MDQRFSRVREPEADNLSVSDYDPTNGDQFTVKQKKMAYADQSNTMYNKSMSNVKFLPGKKGTNSYRNILDRPKMKTINAI